MCCQLRSELTLRITLQLVSLFDFLGTNSREYFLNDFVATTLSAKIREREKNANFIDATLPIGCFCALHRGGVFAFVFLCLRGPGLLPYYLGGL